MELHYLNRVSFHFPVMKLSMRLFLSLWGLCLLALLPCRAWAFPDKPIRIVTGFPGRPGKT
jgi:hypothetical protein